MNCLNECKLDHICCKKYGVTLSKEEWIEFHGFSKVVTLSENRLILGYVPVLKKKQTGCCIFFNEETKLCEVYDKRPQACKSFDCEKRYASA